MPAPATLASYQQQTQRLLNDTQQVEYNLADLTVYINLARGQLAASTQCIRYRGTFTTGAGTQDYPISGVSVPAGVQGTLNVRQLARRTTGTALFYMEKRNWEWFFSYQLCANPLPTNGPPVVWSVEEPGPLGLISLSPIPDQAYVIEPSAVGYPLDLTGAGGEAEAIPYPWTDAVPYFAAYLAYLNTQREADAENMINRWIKFSTWGMRQTTPTVLPGYEPGGRGALEAASKIPNPGFGAPPAPGRGGPPG